MNMKGLEAYQEKKNLKKLEETLRNKDWSKMRQFGRENRDVSRERSNEMRFKSHREIKQCLSKSRQMKVSRGVETSVKEGIEEMVFDKYRYRGVVKEQIIRYKNRNSIDLLGVEKLSRRQELSRSIHQVSRSCQECNKKKLKKLDKQQGIKEVSRRCRASF